MTREEAVRKHRKMWSYMAKTPRESKEEYLKEFDPEAELLCDCYLCEYTGQICSECPLKWGTEKCYQGLYDKWQNAMIDKDYARAAELARQIAELPEKE